MLLKRLLALLLCGTLLSGLAASAQAVEFPDVSQEHWAHSDIQRASDCGLIQGLEDGTGPALSPSSSGCFPGRL